MNKRESKNVTKKIKENLLLLILLILLFFSSIYIVFLISYQKLNAKSYLIYGCDENNLEEYLNIVNNTLFLKLTTNCCGTEFKIYQNNKEMIIKEIVTGNLCRCICSKNILIYPFKEDYKLNIIKRDCNYYLYKVEKEHYKLYELEKTC